MSVTTTKEELLNSTQKSKTMPNPFKIYIPHSCPNIGTGGFNLNTKKLIYES